MLADDQTAATTTANLQALGLSQEELNTVIEGTIGAWATYGDSIPIDGLAESINETVKTSPLRQEYRQGRIFRNDRHDGSCYENHSEVIQRIYDCRRCTLDRFATD